MFAISDALHRDLLDAAPEAILCAAADGRIVFVNQQAERLFGYPRALLLAQPLAMLATHDTPAPLLADPVSACSALELGKSRSERLVVRHRDGSDFIAEARYRVVETERGPVTVLVVRDRRQPSRPPEEVRRLLEGVPDATAVLSPAGVIVRVNSHLAALFGYAPEELAGRRVDILAANATSALCSEFKADLESDRPTRGRSWRAHLTGRRKDRTEFPAEITATVFDGIRGPVVTASIRDISDRVESLRGRDRVAARLEQDQQRAQLAQSQRLESLGQLAGGIAHDFNNLLGVIQNYAAFVGEALSASVTANPEDARLEEARVDIEQIQSAAARAERLARRLLAFARRESIQPEVIDLNALVRDIEQLLTRTIGEHVSLATELDAALPPIEADRGQIEQILVNLAVNARDAMPDGGELTISTAALLVDDENAESHPTLDFGRYVQFRVSDTGTGMSPEVLDRAFDPFFTTKPEGEGSGLGLATVYGIVSQANGTIRLSSEQGVGTTVTILLRGAGASVVDEEGPPHPATVAVRRKRSS